MIPTAELFFKIADRQFDVTAAKTLIRTSYYFGEGHPDVHIQLNIRGQPDMHFGHIPRYAGRTTHSMFPSFDDAAHGISAALNCKAGESVARFLAVSGVDRVALYSRSGAKGMTELVRRSVAGGSAQYDTFTADFVVVVLSILSDEVVITTAYPARVGSMPRPLPMDNHDRVEVRENRNNRLTAQNFYYPSQ